MALTGEACFCEKRRQRHECKEKQKERWRGWRQWTGWTGWTVDSGQHNAVQACGSEFKFPEPACKTGRLACLSPQCKTQKACGQPNALQAQGQFLSQDNRVETDRPGNPMSPTASACAHMCVYATHTHNTLTHTQIK